MWKLKELHEWCVNGPQSGTKDGKWVPAKPLNYRSLGKKIKEAWLVFTGKADCFKWPEN